MLTRREAIALGSVVPIGLAIRGQSGTRDEQVALPDFRRRGEGDDRAAFAAALATGRPIHLPAGGGSGPRGEYLLSAGPGTPNLRSGTRITGDGVGRTIIRRLYAGGPHVFFCDSGSSDTARNLRGLHIADLTLEDEVVRRGFAEHEHLINMNGVTGVSIDRVAFRGFRGDGLYLGSGTRVDSERHNVQITVRNCSFDGVNRNNRNAISVIDGSGVLIEDCAFTRCTRAGGGGVKPFSALDPLTGTPMPGAIDVEPNVTGFPRVRDITVRRCRFSDIGGAAVALLLKANDQVALPQQGFLIEDCVAEGAAYGLVLSGYGGRGRAAIGGVPYDMDIRRNRFARCTSPFIINGVVGLDLRDNSFEDSPKAAEFGYTDYNHTCVLSGNRFHRLGNTSAGVSGMLVRNADSVTFENNDFSDCGQADGSGGRAINFERGDITRFRLIGNRFRSPGGRTTIAMQLMEARLDRRTFVSQGNQYEVPTFPTLR